MRSQPNTGRHPWVYRQALQSPPELPSGTVVEVVDREGFVARGLYDRSSPLAIRIYTLDPSEPVDAELVDRRLAAALSIRQRVVSAMAKAIDFPASSSTSMAQLQSSSPTEKLHERSCLRSPIHSSDGPSSCP